MERGQQRAASQRIPRWWRRPDQYDWLGGYLHARGLATPTRRLMALVSAALIGMPLGLLDEQPRQTAVGVTILVSAAVFGCAFAVLWLSRWPSRGQSLLTIGCGGSIAVATILTAEPVTALVSCVGLVVLSGYLAFFHSAVVVMASIIVAVAVCGVSAYRVSVHTPDSPVAMTGFWAVTEVCVAMPIAIAAVVGTLGADVVRSDHDSLTGVLNRRAFYEKAALLLTSPTGEQRIVVAMIDLDKFKQLNDTYGHAAGDQALTAVGWALRQHTAATALIGRSGGEEFVVIDCLPSDEAGQLPERLRAAIAELPHPVTASVGAAIGALAAHDDPAAVLAEWIRNADAAMYRAKRDGGDRTVVDLTGTSPR